MENVTRQSGTTAGQKALVPEPDLTGRTLGDFRIFRRLGEGGMGQVYLAEQISLKRKVAIKILRADLAGNKVSLQRFKAEAENVARATHANIVQVYAIGEANGLHFMALEYVEGRNLREYLEKKGPPETLVALSIMRQVAAALQRASELGIIHRDIKPENILLTRKVEAKVADFGLSRCFTDDAQPLNLTQSGVSMGTPLYMSPEQVECKTVDHRTDIYSFGATCYHMLAGQPPFKGQSPFEVAYQHVQKEPVPLSEIRPDLPADLCALVHKLMAKKPENRYQTGREIVKDLVRMRDTLVGVTAANPAITMGPAAPQPADTISTQRLPRYKPRRRAPWLVAGTIVLAIGGGLLLGRFWLRPHSADVSGSHVDPAKARPPVSEREKELLKLIDEAKQEGTPLEVLPSLRRLGLLYLKERRLHEAERFFQDLMKQKHPQYKSWGRLGMAMVLAFKDLPDRSNKQFAMTLGWNNEKFEKSQFYKVVVNTPAVREMIAEALRFNMANLPAQFPESLRRYLEPPAAALQR